MSASPKQNYNIINIGERQIKIAPIQNRMKQRTHQKQEPKVQQEEIRQSKKTGTMLSGTSKLQKMSLYGNSLASKIFQNNNELDESPSETPTGSISQFADNQQMAKSIVSSRRSVVQIPELKSVNRLQKKNLQYQAKKMDINSSEHTNEMSYQINQQQLPLQVVDIDNDWDDNDDFLREIEQKGMNPKKLANGNSDVNQQKDDRKIEENYFRDAIKMNMQTTDKSKQMKKRVEKISTPSLKDKPSESEILDENKFLVSNIQKKAERKGKTPNRDSSINRKRLPESSVHSNNSMHDNSSKMKALALADQFSEESEISIGKAGSRNLIELDGELEIQPKRHNQKMYSDASQLFNDHEFMEVYAQPQKSKEKEHSQFRRQRMESTSRTQKLKRTYVKAYEYKRQESRNVNKTFQAIHQVDEKFDIKKEETRLLLNSKFLKARVLYLDHFENVDDVQPMKQNQMRELKRLQLHNRIKNTRFNITYFNSRIIPAQKRKGENINKVKAYPVRGSDTTRAILKRKVLEETNNFDHIMLGKSFQKKIGNLETTNHNAGSANPGVDLQSSSSAHNKQNADNSVKEFGNNQDKNNNVDDRQNQLKLREGEDNPQGLSVPQSVGDKNNSIMNDVSSQRGFQANNKQIMNGLDDNMSLNISAIHRIESSMAKSQPLKRQTTLSVMNDDHQINKQKQKFQYTSTKIIKNNSDSHIKKTKKGEIIVWTAELAIEKIFSNQEEEDEAKILLGNKFKNKKGITKQHMNFPGEAISGMPIQLKNSSVMQLSEAYTQVLGKSQQSLDSDRSQISKQSENTSIPAEKIDPTKMPEASKTIVSQAVIEQLEAEKIELEFQNIRKKELSNAEKRGINKIDAEWSGENVISQSLSFKSQSALDRIIATINHNKSDIELYEGGIVGILQASRRKMRSFCHSSFFEHGVMLCVIVNTVILSLDGVVVSQSDMVLKMVGEGLSQYVSDKMNIFDALIVCLSLFEMIFLTGSGGSLSAFRAVRILRVFRVLRVTRLIRSLQFMKLMIAALGSVISQFIYILLLLFLFMFIYTLLGMSLFGGNLDMLNKPTRMNFDNFYNSSFTVLELLTIENWNDLLTLTLRSTVSNVISIVYLVSCIFIGNYVLMNLVLAIIMDSFDSVEVQEEKQEIENRFEILEDLDLGHQSIGTTFLAQTTMSGPSGSLGSNNNHNQSFNRSITLTNNNKNKSLNDSQSMKSGTMRKSNQDAESLKDSAGRNSGEDEQEEDNKNESDKDNEDRKKKIQFEYFAGVSCKKSLFLFSQQSRFRKIFYQIFKHPLFDKSILITIILSSLKLSIDTYVKDETSLLFEIGNKIDLFFTCIFTIESLVKIISLGMILDENSYLRDEWSQLDFFIVVSSLIDASFTSVNLSAIKILRLLRTLRPLRLLNHNKSMKLIITALMESVGGISNMIFVVILIWLMFAILGLNLMRGKLQYCDFGSSPINYSVYAYHQQECLQIGATWRTYNINCDDIGNSMLMLFILSTFEGWPTYVFNFIDGDESGPIKSKSGYIAVYFAIFMFVGSFFSINLFSAIMSFNFDIASRKAKNQFLTDQQAQWIELQRMIVKSNPDFTAIQQPENKYRFIVFVIVCILANIVSMAMAYETSSASYDSFLNSVNLFFSGIFLIECIIKLIAFGVNGYFFSSWNRFDFFVVVASLFDIVMSQLGNKTISFLKAGPQLARVLRVLRVTRLLKLIKSFQNLQKLIQTAIFALPSLLNATALFLLFYFIFAVLACFLFSNVTTGTLVDHLNNFSNFHSSFFLLFRCSTGENWMIFMFDMVNGTNGYAIMFFVCFYIVQSYVLMNLFVLIIINQFEENYIDPDNPLQNFREQEESFKSLWVIMTKKDSGIKIHERFLTDFYFELKQPIGYDYQFKRKEFVQNLKLLNSDITEDQIKVKSEKFKVKSKQEADKCIMQMNIFCDYEGYIYFNELFFFFFRFSLESKINEFGEAKTKTQIEKNATAQQILRQEEYITLKKINYTKKKQSSLLKLKMMQKRKEGVNPMVRRLFVGMCFSSWHQYSKSTQKKINEVNFDMEDISSESDTDSDSENELNKSDFFKGDEEEGIQFRQPKKKEIISREHTVFSRPKGLKDRQADNLLEKDKYIFLPNTDIYKDDFVQIGQSSNYYSQLVFCNPQDNVNQNPDQDGGTPFERRRLSQQNAAKISFSPINHTSPKRNNLISDTPSHQAIIKSNPEEISRNSSHKGSMFKLNPVSLHSYADRPIEKTLFQEDVGTKDEQHSNTDSKISQNEGDIIKNKNPVPKISSFDNDILDDFDMNDNTKMIPNYKPNIKKNHLKH